MGCCGAVWGAVGCYGVLWGTLCVCGALWGSMGHTMGRYGAQSDPHYPAVQAVPPHPLHEGDLRYGALYGAVWRYGALWGTQCGYGALWGTQWGAMGHTLTPISPPPGGSPPADYT